MIVDWTAIRNCIQYWLLSMAAIMFYFLAASAVCGNNICSNGILANISLIGLLAIMAISIRVAIVMMRINTWILFTPIVAYAAGCALFYGFGPMSTFLASEDTRWFQSQSVYALSARDVLTTNLLTATGIVFSLLGILATLPRGFRVVHFRPGIPLRTVALTFVVLGLVLKHLIIMPSIYGTSDFFVPGILRNLRYLPDLGFALIAMIAASGDRKWLLLFWLIWPWHFILAFPEFSKKSVMLTMLLPALGAFIGHRRFWRVGIWVLTAAIIFSVLQNANAVGRWAQSEAEQHRESLGVSERLAILADAVLSDEGIDSYVPDKKFGVETWWLRLNYSGPQSAAIQLYDSGISSSFTQNPLIYVVPRFLWPGKPAMVSPGNQFHVTASGNFYSRTKVGITIFADGYWQMGWFGTILFSFVAGLIFGVMARLTMSVLPRGQFLYLPVCMLGLQMGATSSNGFLQNGFIAAIPVIIGYYGVVYGIYWAYDAFVRPSGRIWGGQPHNSGHSQLRT